MRRRLRRTAGTTSATLAERLRSRLSRRQRRFIATRRPAHLRRTGPLPMPREAQRPPPPVQQTAGGLEARVGDVDRVNPAEHPAALTGTRRLETGRWSSRAAHSRVPTKQPVRPLATGVDLGKPPGTPRDDSRADAGRGGETCQQR